MSNLAPVFVQVHLWPWSVFIPDETVDLCQKSVEFDFFGSPIVSLVQGTEIYLSNRHEKFMSLGAPYDTGPYNCQIFETPHGVLAGQDSSNGMTIRSRGKVFALAIHPKGARSRFIENSGDDTGRSESPIARTVLNWSQFFDDLIHSVASLREDASLEKQTDSVTNQSPEENHSRQRLPWQDILEILKNLKGQAHQPRMALIVALADSLRARLPQVVTGLRRVLLRERRLLGAYRISETDFSCLQWYIRQPGTTPAEKAGNRQELMGISRRETLNVHENKVLKDFLGRCRIETKRYIRSEIGEDQFLQNSMRGKNVQTFGTLCSFLLREPVFNEVSKPSPGAPPNYVLLNDNRYRKIWTWYCRLLRREEEEDRFWDWQSRTWADISRLLVNASLVFHAHTSPDTVSRGIVLHDFIAGGLKLRNEQMLGCRTLGGTEPGPFRVQRFHSGRLIWDGVLEVVHPEQAHNHDVGEVLGQTGAHLYLVLKPLGRHPKKLHVILIWGSNTVGANNPPCQDKITESAYHALISHQSHINASRLPFQIKLSGLAICSHDQPEFIETRSVDGKLVVVGVPDNPRHWYDAVEGIGGHLGNLMGQIE